jgi:hypothetical protein
MSNRSAKFVSALFASILAGTNFAAVAENGTKAADSTRTAANCLSTPKGAAPAGSHWYYRLDRATKRQCWYVGGEKNKAAARAAPPDASSTAVEAADAVPPQPPALSKSVANARAEWTSQAPGVAPASKAAGSIAAAGTSQRTITPDSPQSSAVASRWPDASEAESSGNPELTAADLAASPQANVPPPQPAVSPVALTAANASFGKSSNSTRTLLMVMASALAFAGLVATLIFKFTRKPIAFADADDNRHPVPWDSIHMGRASAPRSLDEETPFIRRTEMTQNPPVPGAAEKQIAEMLARLARTATA